MGKTLVGAVGVAVALGVGIVGFATMTEKVDAGYAGVVYNMRGGVEDKLLTQGRHFVSPFKNIRSYSVAIEQGNLSKGDEEERDNSFTIPTKDGKQVNADLEYSYYFDAETLPDTYTRFKGQDGKDIEQTFMKGKLIAWTGEVTAKYSVLDIYGEKRGEINKAILDYIKPKFAKYGISIESVNLSRVGLDEQTEKAVQDRVNSQQQLEKEKTEAEKAKIEAEKKKVQAQGEADSQIIKAKGEAEAMRLKSQELTESYLKSKELDARLKHGWVEIQGGSGTIVDARE